MHEEGSHGLPSLPRTTPLGMFVAVAAGCEDGEASCSGGLRLVWLLKNLSMVWSRKGGWSWLPSPFLELVWKAWRGFTGSREFVFG